MMNVEQLVEKDLVGGDQSGRRKPAPMPLCAPQIPHDLGSNPGFRCGKPETNRLSYGTAMTPCVTIRNTLVLPSLLWDFLNARRTPGLEEYLQSAVRNCFSNILFSISARI
jgi:hypothetical protein